MGAPVFFVEDGAHRAVRAIGTRAGSTGPGSAPFTSRAVRTIVDVLAIGTRLFGAGWAF